MKILFVVNSLTHTSIPIEMAGEMGKDQPVDIASLYNGPEEADVMAGKMPSIGKIYGFGYRQNKISGIKNFVLFLKSSSYDVIHTHHALSSSIVRLVMFGRGPKLIHTIHANCHSYSAMQNFVMGFTFNRMDAMAFNSKSSRDGLLGWQKRMVKNVKQKIIYNGVDAERIKAAPDDFWKSYCSFAGIGAKDIVITQIGRLEPVKNPMGALRGFEILRSLVDDAIWNRICFVYVGDGSEKRRCRDYADRSSVLKEKVSFTGMLARDDVYSWMKRADILVVPSFYEGFCNTLVEGLAAGMMPCIADIDVFKEIIAKDMPAERFSPEDESSIGKSMKASVEKIESAKKNNTYSSYIEQFSLHSTVKQYMDLYLE